MNEREDFIRQLLADGENDLATEACNSCGFDFFSDEFLDEVIRKLAERGKKDLVMRVAQLRKKQTYGLTVEERDKIIDYYISRGYAEKAREVANQLGVSLSPNQVDRLAENALRREDPTGFASAMARMQDLHIVVNLRPSREFLDKIFLQFLNSGTIYLTDVAQRGVSPEVLEKGIAVSIERGDDRLAISLARFRPKSHLTWVEIQVLAEKKKEKIKKA